MKALELNLATRPYRNDAPLQVLLAVLAVAALAFTATNAWTYFSADAREAELRTQLSDHRARMTAMEQEAKALRGELAKVEEDVLAAQALFVSGVLEQRNFSWTELLNVLEEELPWNVRLESIRPSFGSSEGVALSLDGMANDRNAYFDFQQVLQDSPRFTDVVPGGWQLVDSENSRNRRVIFSIQCLYLPRQPAEPAEAAEFALAAAGAAEADEPVERIVVEGEPAPATEGAPDEEGDQAPRARAPEGRANVPAAERRPGTVVSRPLNAGGADGGTSAPERSPRRGVRDAERDAGSAPTPTFRGGAALPARPAAPNAGGSAAPAPRVAPRQRNAPRGDVVAEGDSDQTLREVRTDIPLEELLTTDEQGRTIFKLREAEGKPKPPPEQSDSSSSEGGSSQQEGGSGSGSGSGSGGSSSGGSGRQGGGQ